jgi:hypothetical protein
MRWLDVFPRCSFSWCRILPHPPAGHDKDDNHYDERRAEQQQLVEDAGLAVQ